MVKKKKAVKKTGKVTAKKKVKKVTKKSPKFGLEKVGEVTHYFPRVFAAAVLLLKNGLKAGDKIFLKGHTTDFKEKVQSMQLDHVSIREGKKGQEIGLLVKSRVRIGDSVYRI
ncbi:MAG: translation elongation factor-like protein [Candidatus Omnitrophota bacterium]|nr:translation elongation factor-like protein [Candidatus Omnitrophota bacterium]